MIMTDEVCGSCKYNHWKQDEADFVCGNHHSDYFTTYVSWDFSCECWEEKETEE